MELGQPCVCARRPALCSPKQRASRPCRQQHRSHKPDSRAECGAGSDQARLRGLRLCKLSGPTSPAQRRVPNSPIAVRTERHAPVSIDEHRFQDQVFDHSETAVHFSNVARDLTRATRAALHAKATCKRRRNPSRTQPAGCAAILIRLMRWNPHRLDVSRYYQARTLQTPTCCAVTVYGAAAGTSFR